MLPKKLLYNLYVKEKMSMAEIAKKNNLSISKISYWMNKHKIKRRGKSEANYLKYNPNGNPFSPSKNLSEQDLALFYTSLGIYWDEGNKKSKASIRVGNSDPDLLITFLAFLRKVVRVDENRIKFNLQVFKNNNIDKAKLFWAERFNIDAQSITCGSPMPSLGKGTYKNICNNGVMTISVSNTKFREWIIAELKKIGYNPDE